MLTDEQRKAIEWCVLILKERKNPVADDFAETLRGMLLTASAAPAEGRDAVDERAQPSARVALSDFERIVLLYIKDKRRNGYLFDEWLEKKIDAILAASAVQTGEAKC